MLLIQNSKFHQDRHSRRDGVAGEGHRAPAQAVYPTILQTMYHNILDIDCWRSRIYNPQN